MNHSIDRIIARSLHAGVALLPLMIAAMVTPAFAQATPAPAANQAPAPEADQATEEEEDLDTKIVGAASEKKDKEEKVVVTGTSIRGAPPTGTNLIQMDKEGIKATGANSAAELVANIPQLGTGFFNDIPQMGADSATAVAGTNVKPNARGTPSGTTDTGTPTLILLDGQRMAGTGTTERQNISDVNAVPVTLLERVELNTDGGSSIYGSDGIGGVINFITRRKFDGVQVRGRIGLADDYYNYEVGGIVGHSFGRANVYVSYSRTGNDEILNGERDFYRRIDWATGLETDLRCGLPNVQFGTADNLRFYGVDANGNISPVSGTKAATVTAGGIQSPNRCTNGLVSSFTPRSLRNNVMANFSYDFTDGIKLTVRGRYADSKTSYSADLYPQQFTLAPSHPAYRPVAGETTNEIVLFDFSPVLSQGDHWSERRYKQYGIAPELTVDIDGNWQVRAYVNYEISKNAAEERLIDTADLTAAIRSGALDPFNIGSTDPSVIASVTDNIALNEAETKLLNSRVTVDGALFELPGGKVRMAAGVEYLEDTFDTRTDPTDDYDFTSRNNKSVFGELNIPVVSSLNSGPLFEELRFAFSARYDSYSDFGDSFSPRVGMTYAPFKWFRLRGNWGKSFRAPTVIETIQSQQPPLAFATLSFRNTCFGPNLCGSNMNDPARPSNDPDNEQIITLFGGVNPALEPQTGTNWSVAGEIRPIAGLRAELSYYKIDYRNTIGFPPLFTNFFHPGFSHLMTVYPSDEQIKAFLADSRDPAGSYQAYLNSGQKVYGLIDGRTTNTGDAKIEGLDYSARYDFDTSIGAAYVGINGNIALKNDLITRGVGTTDALRNGPNHRASITAGLRSGGFRTQLTLNHTDGYKVEPDPLVYQTSVGAYNLVNAFFGYEFSDGELGLGSFADGLEVTLNINNVFDDDPPIFRRTADVGYANGNTLGRLIMFGVRKDFRGF
jgi:iron complex outermembrane receptor protein